MSIETPTTQELADNIYTQIEAAIASRVRFLPRSFVRALSKALAGVLITVFKYAEFMNRQQFPSLASDQPMTALGRSFIPLELLGELRGVGQPGAATRALLSVNITVPSTAIGETLNAGAQLVGELNKVTYAVSQAIPLTSLNMTIPVRAIADQFGGDGFGTIGNLNIGDVVAFANPLGIVERVATVSAVQQLGADAETSESYRQRVLERFRREPQGGARIDYRIWAEELTSVRRAYPYTSTCPGQVDVYIESAVSDDGTASTAVLQEALDAIEFDEDGLASRRPLTALVNTFSITRKGFSIDLAGLLVDDRATVLADIEAACAEYYAGREPFLVGVDIPPRLDRVSAGDVAGIVSDVVSAAGGIFESVVQRDTLGAEIPNYTLGIGEKAAFVALNEV